MFPVIPAAGVTPAGLGLATTLEVDLTPPVIRAEPIDQSTGDYASLTGDLDPVDASVIEALLRVRKSGASVLTTGQSFHAVDKLGDDSPLRLASLTRLALRPLIERGDINIETIDVTTALDGETTIKDWAEVKVVYQNLRSPNLTERQRTVAVRVRSF